MQIIVETIIVAPALWVAGRLFAGKEKAKFTDAVWIVMLRVILSAIVGYFLYGACVIVYFSNLASVDKAFL